MFESIDGVETLRTIGTEGFMQNRFEGIHAHVSTLQLRMGFLSGLASSVSNAIQGLQLIVLVIWGVYLIGDQQLSLGALFAAVMFSGRAMGPWAQVPALMSKISFIGLAVKITLDILNLPSVKSKSARYLSSIIKEGSIKLKDIEFAYPAIAGQQSTGALKQISFEIKAGQKVAFIGRMGSGKSTLLRVIGGIYSPTSGSLSFDGIDSRQIDPSEVRERVGFVSQEVRLFSGTLRSNILMGRNNISEERFLETCRLTGVDELAQKHPKGYDQPIGEGGRGLSGGQRQLVSLARTLITDPLILLMDEPTSSMDLQSEKAFVQQLAPLVKDRTLIVVTHRPQILQILDRVIVMEQGKLYADGPKEEVLALISSKKRDLGEAIGGNKADQE
jgi:ATP-binding cassette subfamily C protein LapB